MKSVRHSVKKEIQDCPRHSQDFVVVVVVVVVVAFFCLEKLYNKTIVDY